MNMFLNLGLAGAAWCTLVGTALATGETASETRASVARQMTPGQIDEAQARARAWRTGGA